MKKQIIQIMPATDWYAVFLMEEEPLFYASPLAGWALVRDEDGDTFVDGLEAEGYLQLCEETSNFHEYVHSSEIEAKTPDWIAAAQKKLRKN